jgi:hypothetical protein
MHLPRHVKGYAAGGMVDVGQPGLSAGDEIDQGYLGPMGLDPAKWDLQYQPEQAKLQPVTPSYHPGVVGVLQRLAPVVAKAFSAGDWQSPTAKMLARLVGAGGDYLTDVGNNQEADAKTANVAAISATNQANEGRRTQVNQNRAEYAKAFADRVPLPADIVKRKLADKEAEATAQSRGTRTGVIQAEQAAGLTPPGAPKPKAAPKPWNPQSFKLFGDVDTIAMKQLTDQLDSMKKDPMQAPAFQPPRKNSRGESLPDSPRIAQSRARATSINRQISDAQKNALIYHFQSIAPDAAASPGNALAKLREVHRAAVVLHLDGDPDIHAAAEEAAKAIEAAGGKK